MSTRVAGAVIGIVFGVVLSWSGMTSPEIIRQGLLFQSSYLFLFFGAAVTTSFAGLWLLRRRAPRALLTGERVGWGVAGACPGPIATQLGQGIVWGVPTAAGLVLGIVLFRRLQARVSEPQRKRTPIASVIPPPVAADATA